MEQTDSKTTSEYYFDVITEKEFKREFAETSPGRIQRLRARLKKDPDANFARLASLYVKRKDYEKARYYLRQISDPLHRADTGRMLSRNMGFLNYLTRDDDE